MLEATRHVRFHLLLVFALGFVCAQAEAGSYDVPLKSAEAMRAELRAQCAAAVSAGRPMLVEFSAEWCSDCQKLAGMKQAAALRDELADWPKVVINVGQFDRHRDLIAAFGVKAIAHWVVLAPTDCSTAIATWPRLAERRLEPASGSDRRTTPLDLAQWLAGQRTNAEARGLE